MSEKHADDTITPCNRPNIIGDTCVTTLHGVICIIAGPLICILSLTLPSIQSSGIANVDEGTYVISAESAPPSLWMLVPALLANVTLLFGVFVFYSGLIQLLLLCGTFTGLSGTITADNRWISAMHTGCSVLVVVVTLVESLRVALYAKTIQWQCDMLVFVPEAKANPLLLCLPKAPSTTTNNYGLLELYVILCAITVGLGEVLLAWRIRLLYRAMVDMIPEYSGSKSDKSMTL